MKKRAIRILAMLLCVMSFASLLPSVAMAADTNTDSVKAIAADIVGETAAAADAQRNATTIAEQYEYELKVSRNSRVMLVDFNYYRHGTSAYPFPVKFCWYYKRPGSSKWVRMKKAKKYYINFAARGKNGYSYRLKTIKKTNKHKVMLMITWKLKVK